MHRYFLIKLLLTPSILSGAFVAGTAVLVLGITAWSFISERQLFYEYLFGVYGFNTLLVQQDTGSWQMIRQAIFGGNVTYYVLIVLCSLLVGLLVYTLLEGVRFAARETAAGWRQLHAPGSAYAQAAHRNLVRQLARITGLVGWALYIIMFIGVLLPASMILTRAGVDDIEMAVAWGWVRVFEGFVLLALSLHVHVIFIRLVALRPRVFGDRDIEIAESKK